MPHGHDDHRLQSYLPIIVVSIIMIVATMIMLIHNHHHLQSWSDSPPPIIILRVLPRMIVSIVVMTIMMHYHDHQDNYHAHNPHDHHLQSWPSPLQLSSWECSQEWADGQSIWSRSSSTGVPRTKWFGHCKHSLFIFIILQEILICR